MSVPIPRQRTAVLPHEAAPAGSTRDDAAGTAEAAGTAAEPADTGGPGLTLLLIGEDPTSSVPEMRDRDGRRARVRTARNLTEAERLLTDDVHCILLDLAPAGAGTAWCPRRTAAPTSWAPCARCCGWPRPTPSSY